MKWNQWQKKNSWQNIYHTVIILMIMMMELGKTIHLSGTDDGDDDDNANANTEHVIHSGIENKTEKRKTFNHFRPYYLLWFGYDDDGQLCKLIFSVFFMYDFDMILWDFFSWNDGIVFIFRRRRMRMSYLWIFSIQIQCFDEWILLLLGDLLDHHHPSFVDDEWIFNLHKSNCVNIKFLFWISTTN